MNTDRLQKPTIYWEIHETNIQIRQKNPWYTEENTNMSEGKKQKEEDNEWEKEG